VEFGSSQSRWRMSGRTLIRVGVPHADGMGLAMGLASSEQDDSARLSRISRLSPVKGHSEVIGQTPASGNTEIKSPSDGIHSDVIPWLVGLGR
jgi:hypothetical protein